jgi:hypothetical protein
LNKTNPMSAPVSTVPRKRNMNSTGFSMTPMNTARIG